MAATRIVFVRIRTKRNRVTISKFSIFSVSDLLGRAVCVPSGSTLLTLYPLRNNFCCFHGMFLRKQMSTFQYSIL